MVMVDKIVLGLAIICTLTMCSDKSKTTERIENKVIETEHFKSFYDSLDQIEFPLTLTPDKWNILYEQHLKKLELKQGDNAMVRPYARLARNGNFKAFIFVSTDETPSPEIIIFDKKGNEIGDLRLLGVWAGDGPGNETIELVTIDEDLTIRILHNVWSYNLDSLGDRITSSGKLTTRDFLYRILDSGKIERLR